MKPKVTNNDPPGPFRLLGNKRFLQRTLPVFGIFAVLLIDVFTFQFAGLESPQSEFTDIHLTKLAHIFTSLPGNEYTRAFHEYSERLLFYFCQFILTAANTIVLVMSLITFRISTSHFTIKTQTSIYAIIIAVLGYPVYMLIQNPYFLSPFLTQALLQNAQNLVHIPYYTALQYQMILATISLLMLTLTFSSLTYLDEANNIPVNEEFTLKSNSIKSLLNCGSLLLVASVVSVYIIDNSILSLFKPAFLKLGNEELVQAVHKSIQSHSVSKGVVYTGILLSIYMPSVYLLKADAQYIFKRQNPDLTEKDLNLKLEEHGFDLNIGRNVRKISVLAMPFAAGLGGPLAGALWNIAQ